MNDFFVVEVETRGCEVEVYVNDVPLLRCGGDHGDHAAGPVNHSIVDGGNELGLVVQPGPMASSALCGGDLPRKWSKSRARRATATLHRYQRGAVIGAPDGVELASLKFEQQQDDGERPFPRVLATRVELGPVHGETWAWQQAEPLAVDGALHRQVIAFLRPVHHAMMEGDFRGWIDCLSLLHDEWERAYDLSPGSKGLDVLKAIEMDRAERSWRVQPFDERQLDMRLCARRRLVQCMARDARPLLRTTPDEDGIVSFFPALLGRVAGGLRILA